MTENRQLCVKKDLVSPNFALDRAGLIWCNKLPLPYVRTFHRLHLLRLWTPTIFIYKKAILLCQLPTVHASWRGAFSSYTGLLQSRSARLGSPTEWKALIPAGRFHWGFCKVMFPPNYIYTASMSGIQHIHRAPTCHAPCCSLYPVSCQFWYSYTISFCIFAMWPGRTRLQVE
jgi:hypothetical protein